MRFLKTNTATRITVGPFLDRTDGITPEVALTATNEKITLMVDAAGVPTLVIDATATASGGDNDFVHVTGDDAGFYDLELTAAQLNYVGRALLAITYATDHCPVFHEFMILSAQAFDALCGTGNFSADVIAISGDTTAADNCELMFDGTGYAGGTTKLDVGSVGSLATQAKADVNAEVLDVLATDTFAEPAAVVAATSSLKDKIGWLFTLGRNKVTQTATTQTLRNDADGADIATATVSDDGTTFVKSEWT